MDFQNNEFLGRPPGVLARLGIQLVAAIMGCTVLASLMISYRDTLEAQIDVRPSYPPIIIKTKRQGQIGSFLVGSGDKVFAGQLIAKFHNPESYDDLKAIKEAVTKRTLPEELGFCRPLSIGSLGKVYSEYLTAYNDIKTLERFYKSTIENLMEDSLRLSSAENFLDVKQRLQTAKANNLLASRNHDRMKTLYSKGVISESDLDKSQLEFNRSLQEVRKLNREFVSDTYRTNEEFTNKFTSMEIASLNILSEIALWEEQNLLISPINGTVFFLDIRSTYQWVKDGEELFGIVPDLKSSLNGIVKIPVRNSGKVQVNQKVIIKLHSFPFQEWGILEGVITEIAPSTKNLDEPYYAAFVEIEATINDLSKRIRDKGNLSGRCEIILEESTIFKKLFFGFLEHIDKF